MYFRRGNGVFCIFKLFFHDPQGTFTSDPEGISTSDIPYYQKKKTITKKESRCNSNSTQQSFLLATSRFNVYRGNRQYRGYQFLFEFSPINKTRTRIKAKEDQDVFLWSL